MTEEEREIAKLKNVIERLQRDRQTLIEQDHEKTLKINELTNKLKATEEERDDWISQCAEDRRFYAYEQHRRNDECQECKEKDEQYHRMRSAFDRRKQQHQAIAEFFKHYHFTHNGEKMSLTKLIQFGLDLKKQE